MLLEIFAEIVLTWSFHECAKFRGSRAIVGLAGRANVPSYLGDIQKVRSLKIPEFCRPLPPCSSLFVFEHLPPPPKYVHFGYNSPSPSQFLSLRNLGTRN